VLVVIVEAIFLERMDPKTPSLLTDGDPLVILIVKMDYLIVGKTNAPPDHLFPGSRLLDN